MDANKLDANYQAQFRDFLSACNYDYAAFGNAIANDDEMYHKAIVPGYANQGDAYMAYMLSGKRMLDVYTQLVKRAFGDEGEPPRVLEFAGGHGRFTRHLQMACGPNNLVTSDIYRHAVDWQHREHGVTGVYSCADPRDYALVASFDAIFVGSLFSHLPRDLFKGWLERLYRMLTPRGFLAFSVHDIHLAEAAGAAFDESGDFAYARFSESESLSLDIYGMTYVSEPYVRDLVQDVCGTDVTLLRYFKGLYENQDLYVLSRHSQEHWAGFGLHPAPIGGSWGAWVKEGTYCGAGWALSLSTQDSSLQASVYVGGKEVCMTSLTDDASGEVEKYFPGVRSTPQRFQFVVPLAEHSPGAVVKCRVTNEAGYWFDVYLGTIPDTLGNQE